jgi:histidinol-phosphate phosphatase family protein
MKKLMIDKGWTLFLDRDGVINKRLPDDYVKHPDEFELIPGVAEALAIFAGIFETIVVITNQQGIGRGLMTENDLKRVHEKMMAAVSGSGGRIDAVFHSPDLKNTNSFTRKPAVGLGLKARKQFPSIRFNKSMMAGDTYNDILFGHRLGMKTVLIGDDKEAAFKSIDMLDYTFPDLLSLATYLKNSSK